MAGIFGMTDVWNAGATVFNAIKMTVTDTASAAVSRLVSFVVGSNEVFAVRKDGKVFIGSTVDSKPGIIEAAFNPTQRSKGIELFLNASQITDQGYGYWTGVDVYVQSNFNGNDTGRYLGASFCADNEGTGNKTGGSGSTSFVGVLAQANVANATVHSISGLEGYFQSDDYGGPCVVADAAAVRASAYAYSTSTITAAYGFANYGIVRDAGATVVTHVAFWSAEANSAQNNYYFWSDGPGVTRIKEEGGTKGGVYAWYNPTFTKYTPGAANHERGVLQWNNNVLEIGAEAGGTGTQRKVRLLNGGLIIPNVPSADPHVVGQIWSNAGTLMISAG